MFKKLLIILSLFFALIPSVFAATENGVTVNYWRRTANINGIEYAGYYGKDCEIFTDFQASSTKVYNEAGGTSTTSGLIDVRAFGDKRTFGYKVTNTGNGTSSFHLEGFVGTNTTSLDIVRINVGTISSGTVDLPEYLNFVKCGITTTGTTSNRNNAFITAVNKE